MSISMGRRVECSNRLNISGREMIIDPAGANPNHDCLEGRRCPECGGYGPFRIYIQGTVTLMDHGYDWAGADIEDAVAGAGWTCLACGHSGGQMEFLES